MKNKIFILLLIFLSLTACDKELLNLNSLTEPVDATFFSNEDELELALIGIYNTLVYTGAGGLPMPVVMENSATDIAIARQFEGGNGFGELGAGTHSPTSGIYRNNYSHHYVAIGRSNSLIQNMEKAQELVDPDKYSEIEAQAKVIRAYHYMMLTELYGDVPLVLETFRSIEEGLVPRIEKSKVVDQILQDLETASSSLPNTWGTSDQGKITKGVALALKSRIALYNERYDVA
ncbi:MAG: RagB/SusD family nutrient uptake outer membrane protein, partial [Bacteroidales bacterium]